MKNIPWLLSIPETLSQSTDTDRETCTCVRRRSEEKQEQDSTARPETKAKGAPATSQTALLPRGRKARVAEQATNVSATLRSARAAITLRQRTYRGIEVHCNRLGQGHKIWNDQSAKRTEQRSQDVSLGHKAKKAGTHKPTKTICSIHANNR